MEGLAGYPLNAGRQHDADEAQAAHGTLDRALTLRRWTMLDDGDNGNDEKAGGETQGGHADAECIGRNPLHAHRHGAQG